MSYLSRLAYVTILGATFAAPSFAADKPAAAAPAAPSSINKEEMGAFIRSYLMENPEIISDALEALKKKEMENMKVESGKAIKDNFAALTQNPDVPSVGNPKADITVVEFFDYHCGYCKHMLPTIQEVMKKDPNVRFVFQEFPILSDDSKEAAKAALAAWKIAPKKYFEYHTALMKMTGKFDKDALAAAAEKVGIDGNKLKEEMAKPAIEEQLNKTRALATKLQVRGTPAIVVGSEFAPGAIDTQELERLIQAARDAKKAGKQG